MNELSFLEAVGKTNPAYLDECIKENRAETGRTWVRRIAAAAACLVLVLVFRWKTVSLSAIPGRIRI